MFLSKELHTSYLDLMAMPISDVAELLENDLKMNKEMSKAIKAQSRSR